MRVCRKWPPSFLHNVQALMTYMFEAFNINMMILIHVMKGLIPAEYFSDCYNAFFLLQSGKTYFYSRKKAFLQLWHNSFTVVEMFFYNRKNKFCCWEDDKMHARIREIEGYNPMSYLRRIHKILCFGWNGLFL